MKPRSRQTGHSMGLYDDHAALYALAFDWDVEEEATWLLARLGHGCRSVLEPGCGPGRHLAALARRGLEVVGLDVSPAMVELARRRLGASGVTADVVLGDMRDFDMGRRFGGAVCPVNTLAQLAPDELQQHLHCMRRHLVADGRYLVQLDLRERDEDAWTDANCWDMSGQDMSIRVTWAVQDVDMTARREVHRSRIEILSGERAGEVVEELHDMTSWTPTSWHEVTASAGFTVVATYDGDRSGRPQVPVGHAAPLLWHELGPRS
jgi:SAM-dependent methyltransferase